MAEPLSIAYMVSRFPVLTQTFVVREMDALARLGVEIDLYTLVVERDTVLSDASRRWQDRVRSRPWVSREIARATVALAAQDPRRAAAATWALVAGHVRSPYNLARAIALTPKSIALGADMRARGVRHVHAHFGTHGAMAAMVAARSAGITFSFTVHAYDLFIDQTFLADKVRAATFVATISEYNRRKLAELAPDAVDRIHLIRCGPSPETPAVRARSAQNGAGPRILSVAQLAPYKGLQHLIEAASILRQRLPGVSVTIVGEGPERGNLEAQRDRLGLDGTVRLAGAVPAEQIPGFLGDADVFVLPSVVEANGDMDGIPVALMEAMAADLPVVTSRLGGIPELVRDQDTGLLTEPGDAAGLAAAVERLWKEPDLAARLARSGRDWVREEFDMDVNARRLLTLFERSVA